MNTRFLIVFLGLFLSPILLFSTITTGSEAIYDNQHVGEAFDLMCNFQNVKNDYTDGGILNHCTWVESQVETNSLFFH